MQLLVGRWLFAVHRLLAFWVFLGTILRLFDLIAWTHPLVFGGHALHPCPNLCHAGLHNCICSLSPLFLISSRLLACQCTAPQRCRWDGGYPVLGLSIALGVWGTKTTGHAAVCIHMQFRGCQCDVRKNDWNLKPLKWDSKSQSFSSPSRSPILTMHYGTQEENIHFWLWLKRIRIQVIDIQSK